MSGVAGRAEPERVSTDRAVMHISRPVHKRLTALKNAQQAEQHRQVTFTEVIEQLLNRAGAA